MDFPDSDLLNLIQMFNHNQVKYLIVGGYATNFYGYKRATGDIDFWLKDAHENRLNLIQSLEDLEYGRFARITHDTRLL